MDIEEREEIFSGCNFNNCNHYKYRSQPDSPAVNMINYTSSDPNIPKGLPNLYIGSGGNFRTYSALNFDN